MIKRGTRVIWHQPAFNTYKEAIKKGKKYHKTIHHASKDVNCRCFGVLHRPKSEASALIVMEKQSKVVEVPLSQLEEPTGGGNYD